jgi:hypothetical protein
VCYPNAEAERLADDYLRMARRVRAVVVRIVSG